MRSGVLPRKTLDRFKTFKNSGRRAAFMSELACDPLLRRFGRSDCGGRQPVGHTSAKGIRSPFTNGLSFLVVRPPSNCGDKRAALVWQSSLLPKSKSNFAKLISLLSGTSRLTPLSSMDVSLILNTLATFEGDLSSFRSWATLRSAASTLER